MRHLRRISAAAGGLLAMGIWGVPVQAATVLNVPGTYPTIQAAINAAANGDNVLVEPGTYVENIDFKGKLITVQGTRGPGVTTIDGGGVAPVVNFSTSETSAAVLQGFTLQHGNAPFAFGYEGAGVHISGASPTVVGNVITANIACGNGVGISVAFASPTIRDNTISGNSKQTGCSGQWGGGIYVRGAASAQILHNTITNNSTDFGGGIGLFAAGTPTVLNNTVSNNTAAYWGGGIAAVNQSDANIDQNLFVGNSANSGGGLYISPPSGTRGALLVNNTIVGNTASDSGVYLSGFDAQVQLSNNIVTASASQPAVECDTAYSTTSPIFDHNDLFNSVGLAAAGSCANFLANGFNISADPKFVAPGDYHLATGSPAIDAGNNSAPSLPTSDLDGKPRVSGPAVDLGVYELQAALTVTTSPITGAVEGSTVSAQVGQFSGGAGPYSASIAWGDSQTSPGTIGAGNAIAGSHTYAEEGAYWVTVTVTDSTGASASGSTSASVADAALTLAGASLSVPRRTFFTVTVATLTDADPGGATGDYTGQIAWGDGSTSACGSATCTIASQTGRFAISGSHSYRYKGTFTVTIQVSDAGGSTTSTTTTIRVS